MTLPEPPLLIVTDRTQTKGPLVDVVAAAIAAGCRWISLREKDLPEIEQRAFFAAVAMVASVAQPSGARVMVHGSAELAAGLGADGVHLSADADAGLARDLLGNDVLIGQSIHAEDDPADERFAAADYLMLGPIFETRSKPGYGPWLGIDGLRGLVARSAKPVIAVGGIGPDAAAACMEAGAAGIAVMGGVMRADDPAGEVRRLIEAIGGTGRPAVAV